MASHESKWAGVRLWVYRSTSGPAPCSVIVRNQTRGINRDVLIARAGISMHPASRASLEPGYALLASLVAIYGAGHVQADLDSLLAAQPLQGPRGGVRGDRDR